MHQNRFGISAGTQKVVEVLLPATESTPSGWGLGVAGYGVHREQWVGVGGPYGTFWGWSIVLSGDLMLKGFIWSKKWFWC